MRILGIDTATPNASVALVEDEKLVAEEFHGPNHTSRPNGPVQSKGNHAEIVLPLVQSILNRARISLADLSGLAVSIGPGSFTGLRIALATVKGIAYESGLPVVGVSTLHANAARVSDASGVVCSMLDARKQEVYTACFRSNGATLARLSEDRVCSVGAAVNDIREFGVTGAVVVGDGAEAYESLLMAALGTAARISPGTQYSTIAAQVALLSQPKFLAANADEIGTLTPLYLRPSEAQNKSTVSVLTR